MKSRWAEAVACTALLSFSGLASGSQTRPVRHDQARKGKAEQKSLDRWFMTVKGILSKKRCASCVHVYAGQVVYGWQGRPQSCRMDDSGWQQSFTLRNAIRCPLALSSLSLLSADASPAKQPVSGA